MSPYLVHRQTAGKVDVFINVGVDLQTKTTGVHDRIVGVVALLVGVGHQGLHGPLQLFGLHVPHRRLQLLEGQIVGEHIRDNDLMVNVIKTKKLSNMRSSGADDKVKIAPPVIMSLEQAMEYIDDDEYVELTPERIRLRKIYLKEHERKKGAAAIG